ncbi:MAG: hypothetical protein ACT4QC_21015 [Planctomycetaceae bacterium]
MSLAFPMIQPLAVMSCLLLWACKDGNHTEPDGTPSVNPGPPPNVQFQASPRDSAVIYSGTASTPMFIIDPCVIKDDEGYHLFFSSLFCKTPLGLSASWDFDLPYEGNIGKLVTGLTYAFSPDQGLTWEIRNSPILAPSESEWENFRIETANAIVHDGTLHLFYCADGGRGGKPFLARYQLGAVSMALNGKSIRKNLLEEERVFERTRTEPLLPYVLDEASYMNNIQEPTVIRNGDHFELYFTGLTWKLPGEPAGVPGQGITRIATGRAILDDSLAVKEVREIAMPAPINTIEVRGGHGKYYMFGSMPNPKSKWGLIVYLTSEDGVRWSAPVTVLEGLPGTSFADNGAMCPTAVVEADRLVLFYAGMHVSPQRPADRWGAEAAPGQFLFVSLGRAESNSLPGIGR